MAKAVSRLGQFVQTKGIREEEKDLLVIFEVLMHLSHARWFDGNKAAESE